jgi:peptidoglycan/LPS O-acetylase OafA/YrhL
MIFNSLTIPLSVTCNAAGIALLILASMMRPDMLLFRWLEWKPITVIGVASYSIYLWQELFCTHYTIYGLKQAPWFLTLPYWIPATLFTAFLSYRFIEMPFIGIKKAVSNKSPRSHS